MGGLSNGGSDTCSGCVSSTVFGLPAPLLLSGIISTLSRVCTLVSGTSSGSIHKSACRCLLGGVTRSNLGNRFHAPHRVVGVVIRVVRPAPSSIVYSPTYKASKFLIATNRCLGSGRGRRVFFGGREGSRCVGRVFFNCSVSEAVLHVNTVGVVARNISDPFVRCHSDLSSRGPSGRGCSLVLTGPPFGNDLSCSAISTSLLGIYGAGGARLLFLTLFLHVLGVNNEYTYVIPSNILFNSSNTRRTVHGRVVRGGHLRTVVSVPSNIFGPCTNISATMVVFAGAKRNNASGI